MKLLGAILVALCVGAAGQGLLPPALLLPRALPIDVEAANSRFHLTSPDLLFGRQTQCTPAYREFPVV